MSKANRGSIFEEMPECLKKAIEERGISEPTGVQILAFRPVAEGKNALLIAPTGSGKTEAALWPLITRMASMRNIAGISLLYITPLRALNRDIQERIDFWLGSCGLKVAVRHGDTSRYERARQAREPPHALVTTPETLQIILTGPKISRSLRNVMFVVIDEVHELLDDKRGVQLSLALERLRRLTGRDFQRVMLSASLGNPSTALDFFSFGLGGEIVRSEESREIKISIVYPEVTDEDLRMAKALLVEPSVASKLRVLAEVISEASSAIVFTNTRSMAEALGHRMNRLLRDMKIHVHHSSLSKDARVESESLLKRGELAAVISTSSLELGIDIGFVDVVVQYGSPRQAMKLLQRVGRSGHGPGRKAVGIVVTHDADDFLESLVLTRRAMENDLEHIKPLEKSYDVLYHTGVGIVASEGPLPLRDLVDMARKAWPYRELTMEEAERLFSFMSRAWPRVIWYDEVTGEIKKYGGGIAHEYFYTHVSTIPDTAAYPVIDETTGFYVGQLDETFVLEYLMPGVKFVFRGSIWRVVRIEAGRVYVEQAFDISGAVPSWVGEQLPVELETAREVGVLRGLIERAVKNDDLETALQEILSKYPYTAREDALRALVPMIEHVKSGYPIPTEKRVVVEELPGKGTVVHATLGSLVNRTLARILAHVISREFKVLARVGDDPYRIIVVGVGPEAVTEAILRATEMSEEKMKEAIRESSFYRLRLLQVAKRMGLVRDTASSRVISLSKFAKAYEGTPVADEALRETLTKDYDLESAIKVLRSLRAGEIELVRSKKPGPSPLAILGIERSHLPLEIIPPSELTKRLLESFKYRILSQQITLVCAACWSWFMDTTISDLLDLGRVPKCPRCGSGKVAVLTGKWVSNAKEFVEETRKKGRPSVGDWELANRAYEFGTLVERYGMMAAVAMAARAIDPMDVEWVASRHDRIDDEFFKDLAKAETEAVKRRIFQKRRRVRRRQQRGSS